MSTTISPASLRIVNSCALSDSLDHIKGVSTKRSSLFKKLDILDIEDLFYTHPRRYLDFTHRVDIAHAQLDASVTIVATIDKLELRRPKPHLSIVEMFICDPSGVMRLSFFRQPWLMNKYHTGDLVAVSGKVGFSFGFKTMSQPLVDVLDMHNTSASSLPHTTSSAAFHHSEPSPSTLRNSKIIPVYASTQDLGVATYRSVVQEALKTYLPICDDIPAELISKHQLLDKSSAISYIHAPRTQDDIHAARRRFAYEELLYLQLALRAQHLKDNPQFQGFSHSQARFHSAYLKYLPFSYTDEQASAHADIVHDMVSDTPMYRLLLGDVGTGKTAVCAAGFGLCADSHTQACLMAPTTVLATQYASSIAPILDTCHISWATLTSITPAQERARILKGLSLGEITVVFGTTSLLGKDVVFHHLSYIVIDEQHRFGVNQRKALQAKGITPDVLMMSATPIPRTLALSVYGDMSTSIIKHRPRAGARTTCEIIANETLYVAYQAFKRSLAQGGQGYIICPLIDEKDAYTSFEVPDSLFSSTQHVHSAQEVYDKLSVSEFANTRLGLLTGRMDAFQKDAVMQKFRDHEIDILVATTIVEVGVDVPNANVMLIMDADRFGLATLHQLRGRVGRGKVDGEVYVHTAASQKAPSRARLKILKTSSDGFALAEQDLIMRHEGEILGYKQSRTQTLKFVDMVEDADLIRCAHKDAQQLARTQDDIENPYLASLWMAVRRRYPDHIHQGQDEDA